MLRDMWIRALIWGPVFLILFVAYDGTTPHSFWEWFTSWQCLVVLSAIGIEYRLLDN